MATVAIVSGGHGWHVADLVRAGQALGHHLKVIDFRQLAAGVGVAPNPFHGCDAVVVRTMPAGSLEQIVFRMDALHAARDGGYRMINSPRAIESCVSKYLTTVKLAQQGLPTPRTIVCQTADDAMEAWELLGHDVVMKPLFGSEGRGMVRLTSHEIAWRSVRAVTQLQGVCYLQEFVTHPGWDLRVFTLGGRAIAAMQRDNHHDWRTNISQGGTAVYRELTDDIAQLALQAAHAVGADIAGVDLLPTETGWMILEVNAVPGWRALAQVTSCNIAEQIMKYAVAGHHES